LESTQRQLLAYALSNEISSAKSIITEGFDLSDNSLCYADGKTSRSEATYRNTKSS